MFQLLTLVSGIILAIMIAVNGELSLLYGAIQSAIMIHLIGSVFAGILYMLSKSKQPLFPNKPIWMYLGGGIGVATVFFVNFSFGTISTTSIIALGLLGQTVTSLIIDHFGILGMDKRPFQKGSLVGLILSFIGMFVMMDPTIANGMWAVLFAFGSGISIVLSRTVNADLAKATGPLNGSLLNHLVGLGVTVAIALVSISNLQWTMPSFEIGTSWVYIGGILGVITVLLSNVIVPKISAVQLTLLQFIAQILAGIILDLVAGNSFSDVTFWGGLIIAIGMIYNIVYEKYAAKKAAATLA